MKRIIVVIPTYNEAKNIKPLVGKIRLAFKNDVDYIYDILFVDDNSTDGTEIEINKAIKQNKNVFILSGEKQGLGKAYIRGLNYALNLNNYYCILTMDADLSHNPKDLPSLLYQVKSGYDYVIGSRYIEGGTSENGYSLYRKLVSYIANKLAINFIDIDTGVKDLTSGFKAIRALKLKTIPLESLNVSGYVFQTSLLYEFAKRGYKIKEIPITFRSRKYGSSKFSVKDMVEFLRVTFSINPYARLPRVIRFMGVGLCGTIVNLIILSILVNIIRLNVTISYLAALESSVISNFLLNHWFTFKFLHTKNSKTSLMDFLGKFAKYNLVSLGGLGISFFVFTTCYGWVGINYVISDILGIITAVIWNYGLSIRLVWRVVDEVKY